MRWFAVTLAIVPFVAGPFTGPDPGAGSSSGGCPQADGAAYVGYKTCKTCHYKQWLGWKDTPMAQAFDILKPGTHAEAKKKFGIDLTKDFTSDPTCLQCHTTGYGKPGGYPEVVPGKTWTAEEAERAKNMAGVQCEACHGPGSLTGPFKKNHEQYQKAELLKMGLTEPTEDLCKGCHNDKSPTIGPEYKFDFENLKKDPKKLHAHVPLKYKH